MMKILLSDKRQAISDPSAQLRTGQRSAMSKRPIKRSLPVPRSSILEFLGQYLPFLAAPVRKKATVQSAPVTSKTIKHRRHRHRHKKHRAMKYQLRNQRQIVAHAENGSRKEEIEEIEDINEFDEKKVSSNSSNSSKSPVSSSDSSDSSDDEPLFLPVKTEPESHGMWKKGESPARSALAVGSAEALVTGDFLDRSANRKDRGVRGWFASLPSMFARRPRSSAAPVSPSLPPVDYTPSEPMSASRREQTDLDDLLSSTPKEKQEPTPQTVPERNTGKILSAKSSKNDGPMIRREAPSEPPVAPKTAPPPASKADPAVPPKKEEKKKEEKQEETAIEPTPESLPVRPRVKAKPGGIGDFFSSFKYFGMGRERLAIVQNLATMLNAGLPLVDSLKTLQVESRSKPRRALLQRIIDAVENGSALWRAMEDQRFFTPHAIALIRIGEEAGNLAENMEYLSLQQEKDQGLRQKVKMAMIYPAIVLTIMLVLVLGLGTFVLPNLIKVLYSLNVPLPLITRIVIAFTNFFSNYGKIAIPGTFVFVIFIVILAKYSPLRVVAQWVLLHIPGVGRLTREATIARFGVILGGLLQAGVPLVDALQSLVEVTPIVCYRRFYERLLEYINVGNSFSKSFLAIPRSSSILPISVQQLVVTGEKSGSLSKILLKISDIYEKKANETAQKLPVILEPMLLIFMGALVATIAMAIIVPIYSIVGNVGN